MRDRLDKLELPAGGMSSSVAKKPVFDSVQNSPVADAVSALVALGYKPNEASRMVRNLDTTDMISEEIIRAALQSVTSQA
jgi:Holliday junction DNA helicase RuvA